MVVQPAVVLITPGSIRDGLEAKIIEDILGVTGLGFELAKNVRLKESDLLAMYSRISGRKFFEPLAYNLTVADSLLVVVRGTDPFALLRQVKGVFRERDGGEWIETSGLRLKYQTPDRQGLKVMGFHGSDIEVRMRDFRLHCPDSAAESMLLLKKVMPLKSYLILERTIGLL